MTRGKAIELAQRIRAEDDGLRAYIAQRSRGSGNYVVIVEFKTSEIARVIQNVRQWELLKRIRRLTDEEREIWMEYRRLERHEAELIELAEEAVNQVIRELYRKGA